MEKGYQVLFAHHFRTAAVIMRPSALLVLLSLFTSLVSASNNAKGHQTVALYYAYSLEWLAHNNNPTYAITLASGCRSGDCSTFAKFIAANLKPKALRRATNSGIFKPGGPFDTNNPGDEVARAYSNSALTGDWDNKLMYGPGTVDSAKFGVLITKIGDSVDRARIALGSQGQDVVDKIAHHYEEVVDIRRAELSADKLEDVEKNHPDVDFRTMVDNPREVDWEATLEANPDLKNNPKKRKDVLQTYDSFDSKTEPTHTAAIKAANALVTQLQSPPCG
jgi:hypothetical protein